MPQYSLPSLAITLIPWTIRHVLPTALYFCPLHCHICWCRATKWSSPLCPHTALFICTLFAYIVHMQLATLFTQTQLVKQKYAWDYVDSCLLPVSLTVEVLRGDEKWPEEMALEWGIAVGPIDHPSLSTASRKNCNTISLWPISPDPVIFHDTEED